MKANDSGSNTNRVEGKGLILFPAQAAALPGSDAGSDGVEPASSFCHQEPSEPMSYPMQTLEHAVKTWSEICSMAPHSQSRKGAKPHCAWTSEIAQHQSAGN